MVFRSTGIRKRGTQGRLETERKGSGGFQKEDLHAADKALRIGGAFHRGTIDADSTRRTQCHSLSTSDSSNLIYKYIHVVSSHRHLYGAVQGYMMGETPNNRRERHTAIYDQARALSMSEGLRLRQSELEHPHSH